MANEFLKKIDAQLKQRVRDKKMDEKEEVRIGLLSFMLEGVTNRIVQALSTLKLPTPQVTVKPPEVNVTVPDVIVNVEKPDTPVIPEITVPEAKVTVNIPDVIVPEITIPKITVPKPEVTEQKTPQVQIKFPYNLNTEIGQALWNKTGSGIVAGSGIATITAAATAESFAQIRTKDVIRYNPGQGAEFLGTCAFTTGVANSSQVFGVGDDDEGFYWGYNGTAFGVLRRHSGQLETRHLDITAGATNSGNITITMDGTAVVVAVTAGDTISEVVAKIVASQDFWDAGRGWETGTQDNIEVEFLSLVAENASGTFSFVDTDTTGVTAGTFNQATTAVLGVVPTEVWVAQSSFNGDVLDGTGTSGMTLDPTKLNVYEIQYQYLGAGGIEFWIEDDSTSQFILAHTIHYTGTSTTPTLVNPTLHLNMTAKTESGYSGGALVMITASMGGFIQGVEEVKGVRHGVSNAKTTTGTTEVNVLAIINDYEFQSAKNKICVFPDFLTIASEAGKTVEIEICKNPTQIDGTVNLQTVDANNSVVKYDTAGTTVVGGSVVASFLIAGVQSREIDLSGLGLEIRPGERWSITATLSSGANADVTVGLSWVERI